MLAAGTGLFVSARPGAPVLAIELESQHGPVRAELTREGQLTTLHEVRRGAASRAYVLVYDGVEAAARLPGVVTLGAQLGTVRPSSEPGLRLSVRQVRQGVDVAREPLELLLDDSRSVAYDARNVLPLR